MAITAPNNPAAAPGTASVPVEKVDEAAAKQGGGGEDRPGFDLGGASDRSAGSEVDGSAPGSTVIPGGSGNPVPAGTEAASVAGATGMSEGTARSPGGTAGGSKPGEATQATAGAVRPPQGTAADRTFSQGNPDDAA